MLTKILIYAVGILGALGVACGAFGAHFMEGRVLPENIEIWQTAVMYQFFHVIPLALVAFGCLKYKRAAWLQRVGILFVIGIVLFSGSLYLIVASGVKIFGIITPFGGLSFIAGWLCLIPALNEIRKLE